MESPDSSDEETDMGLGAYALASTLQPGGGLKPQMDNIFAEVAKSLPSINFDLSDMSDSEEPVIFHRSLKTAQIDYDDDKDLDTSLSGDSASDLFKGPLGTIHIPSVDKNNPVAHAHSSPMTFDNDLAALLAAQEEGEYGEDQVSSWKDLEKIAQRDKQRRKEKDEAKAAEKKRSVQDRSSTNGHDSKPGSGMDIQRYSSASSGLSRATDLVIAQIEENNNNLPSTTKVSAAERMVLTQIEENNQENGWGISETAQSMMLAQVEENSMTFSSGRISDSGVETLMMSERSEAIASLSGMGVSGAANRLLNQTQVNTNNKSPARNPGLSAAGRMLIAQIEENNRSGVGTRQGARTVDIDFTTNDSHRDNGCMTDPFDYDSESNDELSSLGVPNQGSKSSSVSTNETDVVIDSNREAERLQSLKEEKERRRLQGIERQRAREKELALMYMSAKAPHLSMQILDAIDLDSALDTCNEMENVSAAAAIPVHSHPAASAPSAPAVISPTSVSPTAPSGEKGAGDSTASPESESLTIIQKLAKFSMTQAGQECDLSAIDPQTGASISIEASSTFRPIGQDAASASSQTSVVKATKVEPFRPTVIGAESTSNGNKDSAGMTALQDTLAKRKSEPETVFLDLRGFEKHRQEEEERMESVKRVLGLEQNSSKPDSSDSEDGEAWMQQRQKIKKTLSSRGTNTPSFKQQRLKQAQPARVINMQNSKSPTKPASSTASAKNTASTGVTASMGTSTSDNTLTPSVDSNRLTEEEQLALIAREQEIAKLKEAARVLREQQEKERAAKLRMLRHLEGLRPTASVSGYHPCAENTPVVFDLEASYSPQVPVLPTKLDDDEEVLLITINLSSDGEIASLHSRSKAGADTVINALPKSYTSLLCWLLSLVPSDFNVVKESLKMPEKYARLYPDGFPPFHVIGLQQLWVEEKLQLAIVVCPSVTYKLRQDEKEELRNLKKVKKGDDTTRFQRFVSTFLSRNSLSTVICWPGSQNIHLAVGDEDIEVECPMTFRIPRCPFVSKPFSTYMHIHKGKEAVEKIFNRDVGFFWQTVDSHGPESFYQHGMKETDGEYDVQNTMFLMYDKALFRPRVVSEFFYRILSAGLDIAGLRVVFPTQNVAEANNRVCQFRDGYRSTEGVIPILAVALRGPQARVQLTIMVGPMDYSIAKQTDPSSFTAMYGSRREGLEIFCPRNPERANSEIARWFGGRVPDQGSIDVGLPYKRKDAEGGVAGGVSAIQQQGKGKKGRKAAAGGGDAALEPVPSRPPAALTATTLGHVILAMPPLIPPSIMGFLVFNLQKKGACQPRGIRRMCLNVRRAAALGIPSSMQSFFLTGVNLDAAAIDGAQHQESTCPSTLMILERENALHHASSLAHLMALELRGESQYLERLQERTQFPFELLHLFHFADYSDTLVTALGGNFSKCPEFDPRGSHSLSCPSQYSDREREQVVVVILLGRELSRDWGRFLTKLQGFSTDPLRFTDFELLGLKWLPHMTPLQAREVTPYEIGDKDWKMSVQFLSSAPAVVFAFRGINVFKKLEPFVSLRDQTSNTSSASPHCKAPHPTRLMSRNTEEAYTLIRLFFSSSELFPDPDARALLKYLPESRLYFESADFQEPSLPEGFKPRMRCKLIEAQDQTQESIIDSMLCEPPLLTTFLLVKPQAVRKHLSKILRKIVQEGFTIVGFRMDMMEKRVAEQFLACEKVVEPAELYELHLDYLVSGPCVFIALSCENAVKKLHNILGPVEPQQARRQNQFYWRGIFGTDPVHNGLHGSRTYFESVWDQKTFFPDGLCCENTYDLDLEQIPCLALDSIMDVNFSATRQAVRDESSSSGDTSCSTTEQKVHSLLMQTTCIVLPPKLLHVDSRREAPFVDILNLLLGHGFKLVGARMVWMTDQQAERFLHILNAGSFEMVSQLTSSPCLVVALQRDNAVIAFENTVGGSMDAQTILNTHGKDLLRPADLKQRWVCEQLGGGGGGGGERGLHSAAGAPSGFPCRKENRGW
ncbi:hypothetical protein BaRGS_00029328 [Batillaria attramentaria]|uniref:Nucleoside diphosphate kinase-like domain-containing protein n=1 Tax=Batillaria attramentaria TaxID=370345 RepID=A0ABD0JXE7_9CAEN